jgi:HK97 gp10 family phage protein
VSTIVRGSVTGLHETISVLQALPPELVSKGGGPVKLALAKAARVIRDQAQKNVRAGVAERGNESTGTLEKNIIVSRGKRGLGPQKGERYLVRVRPRVARYANTKRNVRARKAGKRYFAEGPAFYGRFLEYGTSKAPAYPWLRPAVAQKGEEAIMVFNKDLDGRLQLLVKRLAVEHGSV